MNRAHIGESHGLMTVIGNTPFKMMGEKFIISPLSSECDIYINRISPGDSVPRFLEKTAENDYTMVCGVLPPMEFYVDTDETFTVKW